MDDFAITITWIDYLNYNWHVTVQNDHIKGMKKVARSSGRVHDAAVFYPSPNSLLLSFDKNNCWKIEHRMLYCMVTSISQPKIPHKEQEMQSACCDSLQTQSPPPTAHFYHLTKKCNQLYRKYAFWMPCFTSNTNTTTRNDQLQWHQHDAFLVFFV